MKKIALFFTCLFIMTGIASAQSTVKGTITSSEDNGPVVGASVIVKGTTIGAVTDFDGAYTITGVPSNAKTLVISCIGMTTIEMPVAAVVNAVLSPDSEFLDDVVVVAYGTAKKESITGAISTVSSKSIEGRPIATATSAIEGQVAGVQVNGTYGAPGSDPTIRIRGFSSINGSNSPLYVIDGVPFGGNISDINPNDIESFSVLKDAASSALFGNKASNGVILITTKKGKSDRASLRANITQGVYNRGIKDYDRLNADEFMEVMWKGLRNQYMSSSGYDLAKANAEATKNLVNSHLIYNLYNASSDALFDSNGKLTASLRPQYTDLDWGKEVERLGYRQDYNISGDGASDKSDYYFSLGYLDEQGYIIKSDFQRLTGRAQVNVAPREWIKAGFTINGSYQTSNGISGSSDDTNAYRNPFYYARNVAPIYPIYQHDMETGDLVIDALGNPVYDSGEDNARPQNPGRHIIHELELDLDQNFRTTLGGQAYLDIKFLKDFTFTVKGDVSLRNSTNRTYNNSTIGDGKGTGRASRSIYRYKNYTFQQQLNWTKQFGLHGAEVLLGHENYSWNRNYLYNYKQGETFANQYELVNFTEMTSLDGYQDNYRTESFLARAKYNYDNKYFVEGSFRRDGSSRFHPDKRWGNFWSIGGSWIVSREDFMANVNWVDNLKLRASYGEVGNDEGTGYYGYMSLFSMDQNALKAAIYKSQNESADLIWETSASYDIGIDARIFNRVNVNFDFFDKRSNNLLFAVNLPLSAGATNTSSATATITKNIGSISNKGVEFSIDGDVIRSRDFRWNLGINATFLKNTILKLPEENRENGIISGTKKYMEGHGVYDFWMVQYAGVDQMTGNSLYLFNDEDYCIGAEVDGKSVVPAEFVANINGVNYVTNTTYGKYDWSGSSIPTVYGGINSTWSWKNLSLSTLFTYALGGKTIDYSYQSLMQVTANPSAAHKDVLGAWDGVPAGMTESSSNRIDPNGIPVIDWSRSQYTNATSTRFLQSSSYFVVKNVALNYTFSKKAVEKMNLGGLSLFLSGENLATFTAKQGMNPQQSYGGTNYNAFVTARVFTLGVNIKL